VPLPIKRTQLEKIGSLAIDRDALPRSFPEKPGRHFIRLVNRSRQFALPQPGKFQSGSSFNNS
jgi:hypothetical protein